MFTPKTRKRNALLIADIKWGFQKCPLLAISGQSLHLEQWSYQYMAELYAKKVTELRSLLIDALVQILAFTQQNKTAASNGSDGRVLVVTGACNRRYLHIDYF